MGFTFERFLKVLILLVLFTSKVRSSDVKVSDEEIIRNLQFLEVMELMENDEFSKMDQQEIDDELFND